MRRRYRRELYAERAAQIKSVMPHCCIGVDVIVGFPGETEEDFLETYRFIQELDISYLHVFTYSERANTPAAEMPDAVPMEERKRRNKMLNILSEKKRHAFYELHLGQHRPVLWEHSQQEGIVAGFTDNYIKVEAPEIGRIINTIEVVGLEAIEPNGAVWVSAASGKPRQIANENFAPVEVDQV